MLSVRDHMTICRAAAHYRYPAARVTDPRELVGYSEARFAQVVTALLERPEAYPQIVRRLRRLAEAQRELRIVKRAFRGRPPPPLLGTVAVAVCQ